MDDEIEAEVLSEQIAQNELPDGWLWLSLGEVADNLDNKRKPINASERESRQGDVPYYGATGQVGWIDKHLLDEEVVLVGEDGAPFLEPGRAKAYMISGKSWVNNHAHVLRARDGMPNAYLMHFLNILDYSPYVSGTTRLKLTKGAMSKIPVPVAPLPEQRRIVSAIETQLGRLDAAVARLHAAKAKLKRYKQAVLKAAVEGRLTEEWREKNAKKLSDPKRLLETELEGRKAYWLAGQRAKLKSAAVKDSDLLKKYTAPSEPELELAPDIPNAWTWCTWDQITNWVTYGFTRPMPHVEEGPPIVTGKNVIGGRITLDGSHRTTQAAFDKLSEKDLPRANDILITKDGTIGRAAVVEGDEPFCINQSVAVAWMRTSKVNREYLLAYIESPDVQRDIMKKARGVAIKHLSITDFARMNVPLPSLEEQAQIVKELRHRLDSSDEVEATLDAQLLQSTRLRQAVLKRAFEGRLV